VKIELDKLTDDLITNLENLFKHYNGKSNVEFFVEDPDENISVKLHSKGYKVAISNDLLFELDRLGSITTELQ
jgi:hypothetical protein